MSRRIISRVLDFSGGIIGGVSDYARRTRHLRVAENVVLRPQGALSVRKGSQRLSSATLAYQPNTLVEWVSPSNTGTMFVFCDDTVSGKAYKVGSTSFTAQSVPTPLPASTKYVHDQLNGAVWVAENGNAIEPMFYRSSNPSNVFHTAVLPRPAFPYIPAGAPVSGTGIPANTTVASTVSAGSTTLTLSNAATSAANVTLTINGRTIPNCKLNSTVTVTYESPSIAGGFAGKVMDLTVGAGGGLATNTDYWYRLRYRYTDGSSRASTTSFIHTTAGNQTVNIAHIANEIRSDYAGWTLERTKEGGSVNGPFYFLADSTTTIQTTYSDTIADADLGYRSDENVHGEPVNFSGILAFKDRLIAWEGSNVWFSQSIGDIEGTGIANWNALSVSAIGDDDGDTIKSIVVQVDRLIVLKRWSVWAVEGDDILSFRAFPLSTGAGCSGPRAATSIGPNVFFWGDGGMHRIVGNTVSPFGWTEVGHLFDGFVSSGYEDVVVKNYLGQYVLIAYSSGPQYNNCMLAYDLRFGAWTNFTGWYVDDMRVQKAPSFGDAQTLIMMDRKNRSAVSSDYPIWLGFNGFKDERLYDGTGGTPPLVKIETPQIDDNQPDADKDWDQIQFFLSGASVTATASVIIEPYVSAPVSVSTGTAGSVWGSATWGSFTWAKLNDAAPKTGLPIGTVGPRYSVRFACSPASDMVFKGYVLEGNLQPKFDFTRR